MKRQNIRTLSLIICTFTYLLVGAAIFDALESEYEQEQKRNLRGVEIEMKDRYNISDADFKNLTWTILKSKPYKAGIQWKFAGAFYFATTVMTTIGYGHSTPQTHAGKIFCMFYALIGIPLGIVMFQSVGERLNTFITFLLTNIKKFCKMKTPEVSQTNLIVVSLTMCFIVLTAGAAMFSQYENWDFINSFYYCFITLTTIGFGDFVALQKNGDLQTKPEYVALSLIFVLFGITVIAAMMNLLVLRFLTMNTEDERRDQIENAIAAQGAVRLDGDVITANGSVIMSGVPQENPEFNDVHSVCSCSCYSLGTTRRYKKRRKHKRRISVLSHDKTTVNIERERGNNFGFLRENKSGYDKVEVESDLEDDEDDEGNCVSIGDDKSFVSYLNRKRASV